MVKKIICAAAAVLAVSFNNTFSAAAEEVKDNSFIMSYNYSDGILRAVLSVEGNVYVGGFEACLKYDKNKYEVKTTETQHSDIMLNNLASKGKVNIAMASAMKNQNDDADLAIVEFSCKEEPDKSDFNFEMSDVYEIQENYDCKMVEFSVSEKWDSLENEGDAPLSYVLGDLNKDSVIDSSDASLVLVEYAKIQTGNDSTFTDEQTKIADVNNDEVIDASDASKILAYYAAVSTGKEPSWN